MMVQDVNDLKNDDNIHTYHPPRITFIFLLIAPYYADCCKSDGKSRMTDFEPREGNVNILELKVQRTANCKIISKSRNTGKESTSSLSIFSFGYYSLPKTHFQPVRAKRTLEIVSLSRSRCQSCLNAPCSLNWSWNVPQIFKQMELLSGMAGPWQPKTWQRVTLMICPQLGERALKELQSDFKMKLQEERPWFIKMYVTCGTQDVHLKWLSLTTHQSRDHRVSYVVTEKLLTLSFTPSAPLWV